MLGLLAPLLWLLCTGKAHSADTSSASQTVGWQSDPNNGRGTFSLVSSCLLTLLICVYSAMHLNVPPPKKSFWQCWFRTVKWALLGVFGPELVLFIAWKQYLSARAVAQRAQRCDTGQHAVEKRAVGEEARQELTEAESSKALKQKSRWTMVHGFYAGMGGFAFRSDRTTDVFNADHRRLTLTARGVALLADCGLLPDISKETICDKSKSDGLSKSIACVQAAWMIVQIVGRLRAGLQITQLEINTLGHVFCALVIYVLWWHKPRMVQEAIILEGDWVEPLCAYMYVSSRMSGMASERIRNHKLATLRPESSMMALFPEEPAATSTARKNMLVQIEKITAGSATSNSFAFHPIARSRHGERIAAHNGPTFRDEARTFESERGLRWALATKAIRDHPAIKLRFQDFTLTDFKGDGHKGLREDEPEELLTGYSSNWSTMGLLHGDHGLVMGIMLWSGSMAFGGIHAAAWHEYFPSATEAWLWRCSAIYISWSGFVWLAINLSAKVYRPMDEFWVSQKLDRAPWVKSWFIAVACAICGLLYIFARLFLVIEAFISIRQLPLGAYQTPDWTEIIPHL